MYRQFLHVTIAFMVGLSVGGFALGHKGEDAAPATAAPAPQRNAVAATAEAVVGEQAAPPAPESAAATGGGEMDGGNGAAEPLTVEIGPLGLEAQMQVLVARWAGLENRIVQLTDRVASLEHRALGTGPDARPGVVDDPTGASDVLPSDTPEDRRVALVSAGVAEQQADAIVWRQSELELERLELQDRAIREGWFQTERYFDELRTLNAQALDLRTELGEAIYDRYLYQTGEANRVKVGSVIEGSAGYQSGLLPGDIIESYGGERIFTFTDLRNATTNGARDELVPVLIRRDGFVMETWMPRGPIGIRLDSANVAPDA